MSDLHLSGKLSDGDPRPVSRGSKIHAVFLGLDSLYVVLEYPLKDVYLRWSSSVTDLHDIRLSAGIPVGDLVVRRGGLGYKLSVWDVDARLFVTDRVDETLEGTAAAGQGMGLMLQLGPQWLAKFGSVTHTDRLIAHVYDQFAVFGVENPNQYKARLNRVDIALDVFGLSVADLSIEEWRRGWVGYAKRKDYHDSSFTAELEGFSIGSSKGAVRFKIYDKVAESTSSGKSRFWRSVWAVGEDKNISVARFEWTAKPYSGRFSDLRYLTDFNYVRYLELLNYLSERWGRLCIPDTDANRSRWEMAPLWIEIRQLITEWTVAIDGSAKRRYEMRPDLKPAYISFLAGSLAGLMARLGVEERKEGPASLFDAIAYLEGEGHSIVRKAQAKWEVFSRLTDQGGLE